MTASFVALDISSRLKDETGPTRIKWIAIGACVLGLGIWGMHFIAMLAFHPPGHATYSTFISLLSIVPAVSASALAFWIISFPAVSQRQLWFGALFISFGIASMHYIGMAGMDIPGTVTYDPFLLVMSLAVAFAASFAALSLLFRLQQLPVFHWRKIASAVVLSLAIAGMHYTGMAAMEVTMHHGMATTGPGYTAYFIGVSLLMFLVIVFSSLRADKRLLVQSERAERKFQSLVESAQDAIIVSDASGIIKQWNSGAAKIFGYAESEAIGQDLHLIVPEQYQTAHTDGMKYYAETRNPQLIGRMIEFTGRRKDGTEFPIEMSLGTWSIDDDLFFSSIIRDITERRASEERISRLVYRDSLTSLPNRRLFQDRLTTVLSHSAENGNSIAILYLDLDHFKFVNDSFGYTAGDQLIMEVANRLQEAITPTDTLSRFSGDDFGLLLPDTDYGLASRAAQQVLEAFQEPFCIQNEEVFITPSIGISIFPADGEDTSTLMKRAELAWYRVKENGKNHYRFHTVEMNEEVARRSKLAIELQKAVERNEIVVHYQPQIDIPSGAVIGAEALLRWMHPTLGPVSPGEFIPIAEETGAIIPIGEFVLFEACRQNKAWQDMGLPAFPIAVNISARQFMHSDLELTVNNALKETGLSPMYLELELTESAIQRSQSANQTMKQLKEQGIHLSIDDFGTGYSSLSYLKLFPIDKLKIDQTFMRNLLSDQKDAALADTIIRMAHNLQLSVIAEGVETAEQLDFLRERRCDQAQGYLYSRPVPPEEFERFCARVA